MTAAVCSFCGGTLSPGGHFCPSCGYFVSLESANWFERVCAATVHISICVAASRLLIWLGLKWWVIIPVLISLTEIGFQLRGSIGKSFMGLTVQVKGRAQHYLRETIGKLASTAIFGIGFLMIFSKEHLALHDYMAKTSVQRMRNPSRARQAAVSLFLLLGIGGSGYLVLSRMNFLDQPSSSVHTQSTSLATIVSQLPAVATMYVYNARGKPIGQGSGFIISNDGLCVTNFHVIKDAFSADVRLGDGRLFHLIAVHAYDTEHDIAIFQLGRKTSNGIERATDLPFLTLSTQDMQVGERIAIVSSPEGLSNSVADGIISAIRLESGRKFLQISAPISPGSSGGPVFNLKGEVVAVSSFQLVEGQNLNFAIPVDEVSKLSDLRANLSLEQLYWQSHFAHDSKTATIARQTDENQEPFKQPPSAKLTGSFLGTVHNLTADVTANFGIFLEEDQGLLWGCMAVRRPLYGSGPLYGDVNGASINFSVNSSVMRIDFNGVRSGRRLSGTYTVENSDGTSQQGEFFLERSDHKRLPPGFDPIKDCPKDADMNQ
jgi:S1-C subfamily serine protease